MKPHVFFSFETVSHRLGSEKFLHFFFNERILCQNFESIGAKLTKSEYLSVRCSRPGFCIIVEIAANVAACTFNEGSFAL